MILYHYTDESGLIGILSSGQLHASRLSRNHRDVRYGDGQYLTDIPPGTKTPSQLSRHFLNLPFFGHRFTHYMAIEIEGLEWFEGRPGVYVIPNDQPLDLTGRIVGHGLSAPTTLG